MSRSRSFTISAAPSSVALAASGSRNASAVDIANIAHHSEITSPIAFFIGPLPTTVVVDASLAPAPKAIPPTDHSAVSSAATAGWAPSPVLTAGVAPSPVLTANPLHAMKRVRSSSLALDHHSGLEVRLPDVKALVSKEQVKAMELPHASVPVSEYGRCYICLGTGHVVGATCCAATRHLECELAYQRKNTSKWMLDEHSHTIALTCSHCKGVWRTHEPRDPFIVEAVKAALDPASEEVRQMERTVRERLADNVNGMSSRRSKLRRLACTAFSVGPIAAIASGIALSLAVPGLNVAVVAVSAIAIAAAAVGGVTGISRYLRKLVHESVVGQLTEEARAQLVAEDIREAVLGESA
jgi:hypothetical protein